MRICLVASSSHPVKQPFAGGLEAFTHGLATQLAARDHQVTVFAGKGSDLGAQVRLLPLDTFRPSAAAMEDAHAPAAGALRDHHAYLGLMLRLRRGGELDGAFDLIHNCSLHHLPLTMAPLISGPFLTTLHTPPLPWIESTLALLDPVPAHSFVAVSGATARAWAHAVAADVVPNGVDLERWRPGAGGGPAVWAGRLVPEKAPHAAIAACRRARVPLVLAGPAHDRAYFDAMVRPRLGADTEYAGHLSDAHLAQLMGSASVVVVTPEWEEPYGLVAAQALACGTPVAAWARGGLVEMIGSSAGVLARPSDVADLARAVTRASCLDRDRVRAHAVRHCSLGRMVDRYEQCYGTLVGDRPAA